MDVRELGSVDPTELKITSVIEKEARPIGTGKPVVEVRGSETTRFDMGAARKSDAELGLQRLAEVLDDLVRVMLRNIHGAVRTGTEEKSGTKSARSESVGVLVGTSSRSFYHGTHLSTKLVCGHCQSEGTEFEDALREGGKRRKGSAGTR